MGPSDHPSLGQAKNRLDARLEWTDSPSFRLGVAQGRPTQRRGGIRPPTVTSVNGIEERKKNPDPLEELSEYLSHHPGGSLTPWLSWSVYRDYRRNTLHATAQFDGSEIGRGEGLSSDDAKRIAATHALRYLRDNPQPPPPPYPQQGMIYSMQERMIDWDRILNSQDQLSRSEPYRPGAVETFVTNLKSAPNAPQPESGMFQVVGQYLLHPWIGGKRARRRRVPPTTVYQLNDDVLLNIFDWYRLLDKTTDDSDDGWTLGRWWYKLIQVCRVWRGIILGYPTHLDLHLVCTYGTPVEAMLTHSPPFPLIIYYPGKRGVLTTMSEKDKRDAIFALRQRDRVRRVHISASAASLRDLIGAMDDEYPILQRLVIRSQDEPRPDHNHNRHRGHNRHRNRNPNNAATVTLHTKLYAPRMHRLTLSKVALPASSRLLSSASMDIASLGLINFPASLQDFHPAHFTAQIASLSRLKMLTIYFGAAIPNREITRRMQSTPTTTRIPLPCLRMLAYRGGSAYLEGILARLDAPNLRTLDVEFFNQLTFALPSLCHSVRTIDVLQFRSIALHFDENFASLIVDPLDMNADGPGFPHGGGAGHGDGTRPLHVQVGGKALDWQVSSISQISSALAPLLARTERLTLGFYKDLPDPDHALLGAGGAVVGGAAVGLQGSDVSVDRAQWRALLRTFAGVKTLQLAGRKIGDLFRALQPYQGDGNGRGEGGGEGNGNDEDGSVLTPEVLPALQELVPRGWGHMDEAFASFVAVRATTDHPVRLVRNRW